MTIREQRARVDRVARSVGCFGITIILAALIGEQTNAFRSEISKVLLLLGGGITIAAIFTLLMFVRCPRCRARLYHIRRFGGPELKSCSACGLGFEEHPDAKSWSTD